MSFLNACKYRNTKHGLKRLKDLPISDSAKHEIKKQCIRWLEEIAFRTSYLEVQTTHKKALIHTVHWLWYFADITRKELRELFKDSKLVTVG